MARREGRARSPNAIRGWPWHKVWAFDGCGPADRSARHRFLEVLVDLVEEARGREPFLVGADEEGEVLRHEAGLDRVDAHRLERPGEPRELHVVVELGAVREAAGPGEDRRDGVRRGLLALLVFAEVARHGPVRGLGL